MDLRKLRHACILAEEGSFARAAKRLNLTQPALTRSIQALEASLSLRLFDRPGSGVRPTVDGVRVLDHARAMLRLEAALRKEAMLLSRGEAGRIRFGVGPMLVPLLGPVLIRLLAGCPDIDVSAEIAPVQILAERLLDDRLDFFVADTGQAETVAEFTVRPLQQVAVGYFVRAGHPLAGQSQVTPDDLGAFPLASPALGQRRALAPPSASVIACEDSDTLRQIALSTDAVLIGMNLAMQPELGEGRIVRLPLDLAPGGLSRVGVVERAGRSRSAAITRLIAAFEAELAPHAA